MGNPFQCTERIDGQNGVQGYHSNISPKKNEYIVFKGSQILPRFIITFKKREAKERDQEY